MRSKSGESSQEVLLILHVIHFVLILDDFNIASFAFKISFRHSGQDAKEAFHEKQVWRLCTQGFVNSICDSLGCYFR